MKLLTGIFLSFIAQSITFLQLQGPLRYEWCRNHKPFLVLLGIPVSFLYMTAVQYLVPAFDGATWPSRIIGFAIGVIVFTIFSFTLFGETINLKTGVCLLLSLMILLIQIYWK